MVDETLRVVEENSKVGHETLRQLTMTDEEWREDRGKDALPYKPQHATLLDLEAYYRHRTDREAALIVREDPDAPLPPSPLAAVRVVLPTDEEQSERAIEQIQALVQGCDPPPVNPARLGELLRLLDRQSREASVEYPRKRARRQPKKKDGGGTEGSDR